MRHHLPAVATMVASLSLVALLYWFSRHPDLHADFTRFMSAVRGTGIRGMLAYFLVVAASVLVLIPNVAFTLGAGYLYGIAYGSALIVSAEIAGAVTAFLIARYAFGDTVANFIGSRKSLARVRVVLVRRGWRLIATLCLVPVFPFKLSCYLFGLSSVSLRDFVKGISIGLWPITLFNVYLGSVSADLMSIDSATGSRSTWQWLGSGLGVMFAAIALVLLTTRARRKFQTIEKDAMHSNDPGRSS